MPALSLWAVLGCDGARDRVVSLRIRIPELCPEPGRPRYPLQITALGDFEDSPRAHASMGRPEQDLFLPPDTRVVEVQTSGRAWHGTGNVEGDAADVLLWPAATACLLGAGENYPGPPGGQALGHSRRSQHVLLAGGSRGPTGTGNQSDVLGVLAVDVSTSQVSGDSAESALIHPRAFASISELDGDLLVAGGFDPTTDGDVLADGSSSAEVFSVRALRVERETIDIGAARARHGAINLSDGRALLVGGLGNEGPLATLVSVSPESRRSSGFQLQSLNVARVDPQVLRLDDGRIVVAGGSTLDAAGAERPCGVIEWLSADAAAHATPPPLSFQKRFDRAFVAMPGGGVLAVGGCEDRAAMPGEACDLVCPRRGCPPSGGWDAEWISPEGIAHAFQLDFAAPHPVLMPAADGAPWLAAAGRLWRFNPWRTRFEPAIDAPSPGPEHVLNDAALGYPILPRSIAVDAGAFVWLAWDGSQSSLLGFRHSTRNELTRDLELVGNTDPLDGLRPLHLVPDRAPLAAEDELPPARFVRDELGRPALELAYAWVVIADTTYADFSLEIDLEAGPRPIVRIGGSEVGGPECRWPDATGSGSEQLLLRRRAGSVELVAGERSSGCAVGSERAALSLRSSGAAASSVRRLQLTRERASD